jgi:ribonuclease VapC
VSGAQSASEPARIGPPGVPVRDTVTVLDAYALLAYLGDEPAAGAVQALLRSPTVIASVNVAEVVDQLMRSRRRAYSEIEQALEILTLAGLRVLDVPADWALLAGRLRATHYHRERMPLSLADCVAAATALSNGWPLATADPALLDLCRLQGIEAITLPAAGPT